MDVSSPLHKMIATLRMFSHGCPNDLLDEYLQIGETTSIESLQKFCEDIIGIFEEQYLRKPNEDDIARFLKEGEDRGFPGMLGSLDCMHWHWKNYPTGWHGTHQWFQKSSYTHLRSCIIERSMDLAWQYATLIQKISQLSNPKETTFAQQQEFLRKDVERAFGVLQSRWHIVKGPAHKWDAKSLGSNMKFIILHNMIIESEHHQGINPQH